LVITGSFFHDPPANHLPRLRVNNVWLIDHGNTWTHADWLEVAPPGNVRVFSSGSFFFDESGPRQPVHVTTIYGQGPNALEGKRVLKVAIPDRRQAAILLARNTDATVSDDLRVCVEPQTGALRLLEPGQ
jgi:hypothetical protein